jgi:hypothetical protein
VLQAHNHIPKAAHLHLPQHEQHLKAEKRELHQAHVGEVVVHIGQEAIELKPLVDQLGCLEILFLCGVITSEGRSFLRVECGVV